MIEPNQDSDWQGIESIKTDIEDNLKELLVLIATGKVSFEKLSQGIYVEEFETIRPFLRNYSEVKFAKEQITLSYYVFRDTENHYKIFAIPKPELDCFAIFRFDNIAEGAALNFFGMFDTEYIKLPNYLGLITREVLEDYKDIALSLILKEVKK